MNLNEEKENSRNLEHFFYSVLESISYRLAKIVIIDSETDHRRREHFKSEVFSISLQILSKCSGNINSSNIINYLNSNFNTILDSIKKYSKRDYKFTFGLDDQNKLKEITNDYITKLINFINLNYKIGKLQKDDLYLAQKQRLASFVNSYFKNILKEEAIFDY